MVVCGSPDVVRGSPDVVRGSPDVVCGSPDVVRGSPDPAQAATAGLLFISGAFQKRGDLRSGVSAGSGDPRRTWETRAERERPAPNA